MSDLNTSIVRTIVPRIAALLITLAASLGIEFDSTLAFVVATELVAWSYYVVVRVLEEFRSSRWGWLLGKPSQPVYVEY